MQGRKKILCVLLALYTALATAGCAGISPYQTYIDAAAALRAMAAVTLADSFTLQAVTETSDPTKPEVEPTVARTVYQYVPTENGFDGARYGAENPSGGTYLVDGWRYTQQADGWEKENAFVWNAKAWAAADRSNSLAVYLLETIARAGKAGGYRTEKGNGGETAVSCELNLSACADEMLTAVIANIAQPVHSAVDGIGKALFPSAEPLAQSLAALRDKITDQTTVAALLEYIDEFLEPVGLSGRMLVDSVLPLDWFYNMPDALAALITIEDTAYDTLALSLGPLKVVDFVTLLYPAGGIQTVHGLFDSVLAKLQTPTATVLAALLGTAPETVLSLLQSASAKVNGLTATVRVRSDGSGKLASIQAQIRLDAALITQIMGVETKTPILRTVDFAASVSHVGGTAVTLPAGAENALPVQAAGRI